MTLADVIPPIVGGASIGLAAVLLLALNGRIMGVSGILAGIVTAQPGRDWRLAFLAGTFAAPLLFWLSGYPAEVEISAGPVTLAIAGLLVGVGTSLGSGCTSGHGVCGIARLSPRSLVATATFMAVAMLTVAVVRHVI